MRRFSLPCLIGLALLGAAGANAQRQGGPNHYWANHPLLKKCLEATAKIKYAGIRKVTVSDGNKTKTFVERVLRDGHKLRVEFPNDSPYAGQITIETPEKRLQYLPGPNEIRQLGGRRFDMGFRREGSGSTKPEPALDYDTSSGGRVAGQTTTKLEIRAKKDNRLYQRLWIDERRAMILKREMYNSRGEVVGGFEFTSIRYDVRLPSNAFEINRPGAKLVTPETELRRLAQELSIRAVRLPKAENLELVSVRKFTVDGQTLLRQSYVGSLGRVSLFLVKGPFKREWLEGLQSDRYAVHTGTKSGVSYVLIGDVKGEVLKRLASSLTS